MKLSSLFGILLLLLGVAAGVFLVQSVQDFRERAKEPTKYKICHKTGSADNPYVTIEVDDNALEAHINHGDTIGECHSDSSDEGDGRDNSETAGTGGTSVGTSGNSNTESNSTNNSSEDTSGAQVITETRYVYLNPGTLEFYIKFFGVNEKREDKSIRVEMRKADQEVHIYEDVTVSANTQGIYRGTLRDVPAGTYDILIKGVNHLQVEFENVPILRGFNRWYWSGTELLPGDMDSDNDVDIEDVAIFLAKYDKEEQEVSPADTNYDLNFDGKINKDDLDLILESYSKLIIKGDS